MRFRIGSMVISAVLAGSVAAAESTLTLDPTASRITFTLKATLHQVDGSFDLTSGEIRFDPETGTASGRVVVDARSGDTENAKRDKKMHETVLKSVEHPLIVFEPTSFEGTDGSELLRLARGQDGRRLPRARRSSGRCIRRIVSSFGSGPKLEKSPKFGRLKIPA